MLNTQFVTGMNIAIRYVAEISRIIGSPIVACNTNRDGYEIHYQNGIVLEYTMSLGLFGDAYAETIVTGKNISSHLNDLINIAFDELASSQKKNMTNLFESTGYAEIKSNSKTKYSISRIERGISLVVSKSAF